MTDPSSEQSSTVLTGRRVPWARIQERIVETEIVAEEIIR